MSCDIKVNSIKYLMKQGAVDNLRGIINEKLFNELNDQLTVLAEQKYGLQTLGGKLFSIKVTEYTDARRSAYYRDAKFKIYRALPNEKIFERLQELYDAYQDKPMFMKTPVVDFSLKIINALDKINRNKFETSKLQGWLNDLQKQGVSAQQIELFKEVAKPGMTKDEIAIAITAAYSYTVEINTSKENKRRRYTQVRNEKGKYNIYTVAGEFISSHNTIEEADKEVDNLEFFNTDIYSNLTVPGGTNYTENEIATPDIIPNIKGHAQFATNKGIGWFRSDDQAIGNKTITEQKQEQFELGTIILSELEEDKTESVSTKTRRILEVQSDLFQKGRDKKELIGRLPVETTLWNNGVPEDYTIPGDNYNTKENQFLQLLNKDNNWVTFFLKSIMQDSAKKGYEKVLFPTGNTASKIEGHTTLEEFKKQKEDRIKELEKKLIGYENAVPGSKEWIIGIQNKKAITNEITQLKQELERVEGPEGFGALQPIYTFYENTVTNILRKQFGKERVKQVTDEYGNTWNELTIEPNKDLDKIMFLRTSNNIDTSIQDINGVLFMDVKLDALQNERSKEVAEILAQRLALGMGVQYNNVTQEEAADILKNTQTKYNGEPAFYYAGTVYTVGENVNVSTVLHEFAHPVLQGLRKTNNILFQKLYNQALDTEEGQGIRSYVKAIYPELNEFTDLFKEEVLAYALQLRAVNKINKQIESEGFESFMNKLLASIKQLLRKIFGSKVDVSKLDVDTTLEEMADMLLDSQFEFKTDLLKEEDLVMYARDVVDRARELTSFSDVASQLKVVEEMYDTNKRILSQAENFVGDAASKKFLKESIFEKGTNRYIREVVSTLKDNLNTDTENFTENELIQNALDAAKKELDVDLQRAIALVNSLDNINSMTKNMLLDISRISKSNINNTSSITLLMLYKNNGHAWLKMIEEIDAALTSDGDLIDSKNPFYQSLNEIVLNITRINTNIANILKNNNVQFYVELTSIMSKYVQDKLKENLGTALKKTFVVGELEREVDNLYNKVVQQTLKDEDIEELIQKGVPANVLKGFLQEYKDLVVDEEKITAALTGGARDITWFNRWLESYSSSNDVVAGPLAIFIENEKTQVKNLVWQQSMKFRNKLEELLPKVGFSKLNSIQMREKLGFKDKILWFNKDTGETEEKEIYSYLDKFKDYRYHYDLLDWNVEAAKKTEDPSKIAQAVLEFDEFKKDYMWQEFVPEVYEKDAVFKDTEIGKLAYYVRKQKLQTYNNLLNSMENEYERFEQYSTTQAAFREYQQLYSLTYEDSTPKVDDPAKGIYDLSIAELLIEHRANTKQFNEWRPIEGLLQSAYNEFVDFLATKNIIAGSADFKKEIEKWRRQNLRMEYDPIYWESKNALTAELRDLQVSVSQDFQIINDLIYSYRDEQGQPDSSAMGKARLEKIRDAEQAIADYKFEFDASTGLSKEDSDELRDLSYKARKGLLQPGSLETKRYMYLLDMRKSEGISPEDAARITEIFSELADLSQNIPTVYYAEVLNYNLSKQNIKELDEDDMDKFINDEEFQQILNADESFREWFEVNHYIVQTYDKKLKDYVPTYKRTRANSISIPKDSSYIKYTEIIDKETGEPVLLMGVPNARHSRFGIKNEYRTIPFGEDKADYVGTYVDNKNQWLPRLYEPGSKYNPKNSRFMNERYFQMKASNSNEYKLLEAIKEYHLENQKGQSNYSKLYLDMPRYSIKKMDIYQALQKNTYGQRFSEFGKTVKEWTNQMVGKSVMDYENDLNYDPKNNLVNTDLNGTEISYVPVSGIYNLDINVTDADVFSTLFRYALSVQTQGKLLESLPLVQSLIDTLEDPENAPKDLEKFDKNVYNLKGLLKNAKKKFASNNRLGQVKSLMEREYAGKKVEGLEETHPRLGKWIQNIQGLSSMGSLALNIQSDLKNKYGAYVQLIIEGMGSEFINLKDIALARPWAEKAMLEWTTKGIYQTGPGAISTQLIQLFDPTFKAKDEFGREVERSLVKDLVNMEWLYMHRKFGEMQVAVSLFGSFMYGQKIDQILGDGTKKSMRYIEAWEKDEDGIVRLKPGVHPGWSPFTVKHAFTKGETLEQIAKKYYIPVEELKAKNRIKSEIQLEDGQEIIISKSELFLGLKNRIQGTSRKLFGAYDDMGQPEGNKNLLYRMFFFMRKWFTPMLMNRFGFDSKTAKWTRGGERYDWATASYGKGFYVTAFQVMLKTLKSGFRDYAYLTNAEKTAVRKASGEAFFTIGFALLVMMLFGFDPDDEDKWKKLKGRSGAINEDNFNTYGFFVNHMLLLTLGVQAETSAFIPLPAIKGVNLGADDYVKMITQTTTAWYNTVVLYIDIFGDALDFATLSEMDRYKKDTGPYPWKEKDSLKIWAKLLKTIGATGSTGDPATQIEFLVKNSSAKGGAR